MTRTATLFAAVCLLAGTAAAQPSRTADGALKDAIWARDVGAATLTLDGNLNEPEWAQAQSIKLSQDGTQPTYLPGGGAAGRDAFNGTDPVDAGQAIVRFLRKGNVLYIGADVNDASIGGRRDFFAADGFVFALLNRARREALVYPEGEPVTNASAARGMSEIIYSWANVGPFATPVGSDTVGIAPSLKGNAISDPSDGVVTAETMMKAGSVSNDDRNGTSVITADVGYTMEIRIDLGEFGYDFTQTSGDRMAFAVAFYDLDYNWPVGQDDLYQGRAWWMNFFANNLNQGTAFLYGSPAVTVSSGVVPNVETAEIQIPVAAGDDIVVDGKLSESAWTQSTPQVSLQYQPSMEFVEALPSIGPDYNGWFRPDGGVPAEDLPALVDKTVGRFSMLHKGSTLYVGLDTDDQAVSGQAMQGNESRYDGFRLVIRDTTPVEADNYVPGNSIPSRQFTVVIDSTGTAQLRDDAADPLYSPSIEAGAFLKGTGTAGNSMDIDSGYQIEMSVNLDDLGFDTTNRLVWIGLNYFDGDDLAVDTDSYGTRAWWLTERTTGPTARVYLNPTLFVGNTAGEAGPGATESLRALGAAPNPTTGETALRYQLATASSVTVEVFDVLGRQVGRVEAGSQSAGPQQVTFDVSALGAGTYVYRVRTAAGETATGRLQVVR